MTSAVAKTTEPSPQLPEIVTPAAMIQQAIQQGSGVEVMERLLALQERYDAYNARKAFDDAMADLRNTLPKIVKSREVDFTSQKGRTHYKFEDLAEITETIAGPMSAVGLSFRWYTDNVAGGVKVTCRITHRSGHYEETSLVGPLDASGNKNPIQAIGSAVSYLQRYTLKAAVGIAAAQDDDAQEVGRRASPPKREPAPAPASPPDKATAQATFDRLLAANAKLATIADHGRFWTRDDVRAAANGLPLDMKQRLAAEKHAKGEELSQAGGDAGTEDDGDIPFPGDLPMPPDGSDAARQ